MLVEASILVDAPREDIFDILTEYGSETRLRINPSLKAQSVVSREANVVVCDNEWERDGKRLQQRRRYTLYPPERIEEEIVGTKTAMIRVVTRLDPEGDQTRLTLTSEYRLGGLWRILSKAAEKHLREADDALLATLKERIEAEFEEVEDETNP